MLTSHRRRREVRLNVLRTVPRAPITTSFLLGEFRMSGVTVRALLDGNPKLDAYTGK
jgi:hypothetical protein